MILYFIFQLTASLGISTAPGEAQKQPDDLKNGYYKGSESNRPKGQRRSPP